MCTSPLIRFRLKKGADPDTIIGVSSSFQIKSLKELESFFLSYSAFKNYFDKNMDYQYIKCRKCVECRAEYAQEWSIRCFHEYQIRQTGSFITLTIDDVHVRDFLTEKNLKHYCKRCVKGNRYIKYPINYTLCKGLIQDFLKKLRDNIYKQYGITIRYFGCGEYGENNERPHYHILIFGFDFPDKKYLETSNKGFPIYVSDFLFNNWNYGLCTVQDVDHRVCMYTAKYVMKKIKSNDDIVIQEQYFGREPEFIFMSKGNCQVNRCKYIDDIIKNCKGLNSLRNLDNPYCSMCSKTRGGIGFDWFRKYYKDVLKIGYITIDGIKYSIPKYYLEILKLTDSELYDTYKVKLLNRIDEKSERDDRSTERLQVKAKIIKSKLKLYHRE